MGSAGWFRALQRAGVWSGIWLLALIACQQRRILVISATSVAQTVSLLGDTLYNLPRDPASGPARVRRIQAAREALARDSSILPAWLRLGNSTVEMGNLHEAVSLFTSASRIHFTDPRIWRHRGELLLRLRYIDAAIGDLRKAGLLALHKPTYLETPRGAWISGDSLASWGELTTLQYQVPFLLGIALYCKGNYPAASEGLAQAVKVAVTTEESARALLWLFFAVRRIGDGNAAARVLALMRPEWTEQFGLPEMTLLLAYRGSLSSDSIRQRALARSGGERALFSYGIAFSLLLKPEARLDAELWLQRARSGADWAALPYLAAEADLARLRGRAPPVR